MGRVKPSPPKKPGQEPPDWGGCRRWHWWSLAQERTHPLVGAVEALAQVCRGLALMGQGLALTL